MTTDRQQLLEARLGEDLAAFVKRERDDGLSWYGIAALIGHRTGIRVSHESLRTWYAPTDTVEQYQQAVTKAFAGTPRAKAARNKTEQDESGGQGHGEEDAAIPDRG